MLSILLRFSAALILSSIFLGVTPAVSSTFMVTTTSDGGPGSLRQAVLDANASAGLDRIEFAIPGASPFSIMVSTPLPPIVDPVVIDGDTQSGVQIDGSSLVSIGDGLAVVAGASGSEIWGLEIAGFPEDGISLEGVSGVTLADNVLRNNNWAGIHLIESEDNDIGVMGSGNALFDNVFWGIFLEEESHGNRVTDNDVWASIRNIFLIFGASDNSITHNRVYDAGNQGIIGAINTDRNDISYNHVENSFREGIELSGTAFDPGAGDTATENVISHNILVNNSHSDQIGDITLFDNANGNVIRDNHIFGSDDGIGSGIQLQVNNNNNQILDNVIVGAFVGIELLPTTVFRIGSGFHGGASGNVVKGNEVRDSILDGISNTRLDEDDFWGGTFSDNVISQNAVSNSGRHGVHIANSIGLGSVTNNRIDENLIKTTAGDGAIIDIGANGNRVTENTFRKIGGNGVTILGNGNRVDENKFQGVKGIDIDDQGVGNITE